MLDTLLEIFYFLQGTCYAVYSACDAIVSAINFLFMAIPYARSFISSFGENSLFSACFSLCLGLGLVQFLYPGAD